MRRGTIERSQNYRYNLRNDRNNRFDLNRDQNLEKPPAQNKQKTKPFKSKKDLVLPLTSAPLYMMPGETEDQHQQGAAGVTATNTSGEFRGFPEHMDFNAQGSQPTRQEADLINARLDEMLNQNVNSERTDRPRKSTSKQTPNYDLPPPHKGNNNISTGAKSKLGRNKNTSRDYNESRDTLYPNDEDRLANMVKRMVNLALREQLGKAEEEDNAYSKPRNRNSHHSQDKRNNFNSSENRRDFIYSNSRNGFNRYDEEDRSRRNSNFRRRPSNDQSYDNNAEYNNTAKLGEWGFKFDGFNYTVSDFIFRVEDSKEAFDCSWDYVVQKFHFLLIGKAEKWFWVYKKNHRLITWNSLKVALEKNFGLEEDEDILQKMFDLKQQPNESFAKYFEAMCELNNRLTRPMNENDKKLIKRIASNVSDPIRRLTFNHNCMTIYDLYKLCINAEKLVRDLRGRRYVGKVNELREEIDSEEEMLEVHAYTTKITNHKFKNRENQGEKSKRNPATLACYCCQDPSHGFYQCPYRGSFIYCFKCHKPGVITQNCPRCNKDKSENVEKENWRKSVERPGNLQTDQVEVKDDLEKED